MPDPNDNRLIVWLTRGGVILGSLTLAVVLAWLLVPTQPQLEAASGEQALTRVVVFEPAPVPVRREFIGYGPAAAMRSADVPARVGATVTWINPDIDEGAMITAGDPLVRLDAEDFERRLNAARQSLTDLKAQRQQLLIEKRSLTEQTEIESRQVSLTKAEFERVQTLQERGSANQQDVDAAERQWLAARRDALATDERLQSIEQRMAALDARVDGAEQEVELAQLNLDRTQITSPISGVLQTLDVELGENVAAGSRVARVVNLDKIEVALRLPSSARRYIGVGDTASLSLAADPSSTWSSPIRRLAPEDDAETRTLTAYVEIDQPQAAAQFTSRGREPLLTPGAFVTGRVRASAEQERWVVPRRSLREGRVFVVTDGVVRSIDVQQAFSIRQSYPSLGLPDDEYTVLTEPLPEGSVVVVNASASIGDGQEGVPVVLEDAGLEQRVERGPATSQDVQPGALP